MSTARSLGVNRSVMGRWFSVLLEGRLQSLVEELCVGDLALALDASEDAVTYGLRILRTAGLVANRRDGRVIFYRLADNFPEPLLEHCLRQLIALSDAVQENEEDG